MNRKLVGGVVALVVLLGAGLFFWLGSRDDANADGKDGKKGRSAAIRNSTGRTATEGKPAPRGGGPRWTLDVDPAGPLTLEGQVVGPDGNGVGGAEIELGSVPPRTAKSNDDGSFAFDKLVGRTYVLTAKSGDLIGGPVMFKLTENADPVVIRLAEGAAVKVLVVDEAKKPIAGAEVRYGGDEDDDDVDSAAAPAAHTDPAGEATIKPVHPGWVSVEARADGYAPASGFTTIGSGGAVGRVTVTLHEGVPVSGRVVDEAGKPIAKARVTVSSGWDFAGARGAPALTDDKGQFKIAAVGKGSHSFAAVDGEHAPARSPPYTIGDRAVTDVEITMKSGGTLAGKVTSATGEPVPYATIRVAGKGQQAWMLAARQATTDEKGTFELHGLARTKLQARAEAETAASKLADVDLTDDAKKEVSFVLDVAGTISGVVVDDKGSPVAEIQVNAFPDVLGGASTEGLALAGMSSATTDGAGAFTLRGLADGQYRLWAARSSAMGFDWGQHGTSAKPGDKGVRLVLPAAGTLVGKIQIEGSSAAPKLATVQLGLQPATPANDGAFSLKEVTPGKYDVTFRGPEFAEFVKRDVVVDPGKTTDLGTVTVMRGHRVAGKVVDSAGQPVAGAKVKLGEMLFSLQGAEEQMENFEDQAGIRSTVTDRDGDFTLIGVPKKATSIFADHPTSGRSLALNIPEGVDDPPALTLTLRGFGSISGKVTMKGKPVGEATVGESSKGGAAQATFAQTDDNGAFHLAKVPEGTHVLQAIQQKMMSMKSATVTVQVVAGKESVVNIDIPVGTLSLTVQVKALPGQKVDWAQTFLMAGTVSPTNGKQLLDAFLQGGAQGMKFWMGEGTPLPEFDELVAGDYSVCTIPITGGKFDDIQFQQRLQQNSQNLKCYCKPVKVAAAPAKQTFVAEVPSMDPLPAPGP